MSNALRMLFAVNPAPWARAQMAFTLAAHIILVAIVILPSLGLLYVLGLSWGWREQPKLP